jgi:hypothetical protein
VIRGIDEIALVSVPLRGNGDERLRLGVLGAKAFQKANPRRSFTPLTIDFPFVEVFIISGSDALSGNRSTEVYTTMRFSRIARHPWNVSTRYKI